MNFITNLSYDGGTNLSAAVNWAAKSFSAINGVIGLLFSDGLTSWGEEYKTVEMLNIPFFTFTASVRADFLVLQRIASGTGGLFFNLQENKDVSAVLATRVYYMRATDVTGRIVSDVYPSTPQPVGTPFWISGKIITPIHEDIITIHFCVPSTNISFTKAVSVSRNTVTTAPMGIVSRFWAQMLVNEKASFGNPSHSKENIISLARKYKFVTDDTSFMLLDSLDQYLEHGIEPADSLPEIKKEYEVKIALREAEKARDLVQYSQYVAKMWRRRVSWWEAHYDGCTRNCLDLNFLSLEAAQYQVNDNNRPLEPDFIPPTPEPAPKPAVEAPRAASGTFGLFGRRKLHPPPEPSELIKNLREASEAIEKRGYQLEKRIKTEKEKALAFHRAKNKRACMFSLKQAKLLSSQMESLFTRQTAIEQTLLTLESATTNLECMKIGAAALGQAPSVTLSVEDSMDSIRDQLDSCEEISDAISQPISEIFDEEELEQELEELVFAESGQETIMKTIACTPQSSGVQLNRSEDDELAELERMMMGDYSPSLPTNTSEEILHQNGSESVTQEFCQATQYPAPDPVQSCGHFSLEAPVQPFSSRPEGDEKYDFSLPSVHDRGREVSESDVEKSGWCTKQGGSLKSWKRRFYVLKGNNLLYFKSPTEKEPVACIKLDPRMEITKEERHTRHVLTIKIPRRSYIMNLDSKEEIDSWVDCLQRKLATLGPALQILPIPQGQRILPMINNSERFFLSLPDVTVLQEYGHVLKRHSNILNSLRTIIESNSVLCLNPAFFIQVALCLFEHGGMSLLFLSNMTESNPENSRAIRSASFLLMQAGLIDEAIYLLEKCLKLRQEEPQSHRDLALALMQTGKPGDLERALSLMHHVITQRWDTRFAQIQVVALMEFNSMLTRSDTPSTTSVDPDPRIISPIDVDIRCVMQWDTDMTDVELIVIEPNGEKCFSFNNLSKCGALVSKNFSRGYGPTEYIIKKAVPGTYKIFARLYHTPDPSIIVTTCVSVTVDFGRTTEQLVGYCVAPVSHKTPEVLVGTIDCTN
ncbi:Vault protein inter-alpha-trypsin domain protein [Pelomyxa schiedti]|nr:Vault protein inter-alpha-trypsin domain protein [Pelomyxa schiedti]